MTDVRHSQPPSEDQVERYVFLDTLGQPGCEALVNRKHVPRGYCAAHDLDRRRSGKGRKK